MGLAENRAAAEGRGDKAALHREREATSSKANDRDKGKRAGTLKARKRVRKIYLCEKHGEGGEHRANPQVKADPYLYASPLCKVAKV